MVNKKNESSPAPKTVIPELKDEVSVEDLTIQAVLANNRVSPDRSGGAKHQHLLNNVSGIKAT